MAAAVTSNPAARAAEADVRASVADLARLRSEYEPTVNLFGEVGGQIVDNPSSLAPNENNRLKLARQIGVGVEFTLFDGYRRSNLVYRNSVRIDGAIYRRLDAAETLALTAVEAYIDVVRLHRLVALARDNVVQHQQLARQVRDLVDGGRLPASDGFLVDDRILAAQSAVLDVERSLSDAKARYERVVGHLPSGAMSVPYPRGVPRHLDAYLSEAVAASNKVAAAGARAREPLYDKNVALARRLPRVTLNAGVAHGIDRSGSFGSDTDAFVGLRFNWQLYGGGRDAEEAYFDAEAAQAAYEAETIAREVREIAARAWNGYQTAIERRDLLARQVRANQQIVRQYRDEVEAAKRSLIDVLEAERTLFNIRFQEISADSAVTFGAYRLLAAKSALADHFGLSRAAVALAPGFEDRAQGAPTGAVFNTSVPPLE
ncbi:TolC family protein [Anianabacter salinae]|uniref:TolC family protein n=1 Tax=Anianabacter salinae TaxID=2851023 RepID=UPI00225E3AF2|nr:TolC family protein [Anianabacter salinae]MBV0911767.1 TolC family protein [Anianabacter salinae]